MSTTWVAGLEGRRAPTRVKVAWFEELLTKMATAPDRVAGVIRARVEDDGGRDFDYRVVRDGRRVRCSALDGGVHVIANATTQWRRRDSGTDQVVSGPIGPGLVSVPDDYEFGTWGFDPYRWEGDDFTEPIGGPQDITMLGRPAWRITLAPPPHKPAPMHMVVDQATFLVLRQGNDTFGTFHEWTELDTDPEIDDAVFTWTDTDRAAACFD